VRKLLYRWYEGRIERSLNSENLPRHIGVMVDGNRRWARVQGDEVSVGHAAGARKIIEFLQWCTELKIPHVTLYLLSTDNLSGRDKVELKQLVEIITQLSEELARLGNWRLQIVGDLLVLDESSRERIRLAESSAARNGGTHVNLAIAYGGRKEIADAMRAIVREHATKGSDLEQLAAVLTPELIAEHLYTGGQPDPDLLIRTSGEQRLSGFLLWQSANSEFYFAEALWPDFRRVDFLRAIRAFGSRRRRFGR